MLIFVRNPRLKTTMWRYIITLPLGDKVHFVYEESSLWDPPPKKVYLEHFDWIYSTSILLVPKFLSKQFNKILAAYVVRVELIKGKNLKGAPKCSANSSLPRYKTYGKPANGWPNVSLSGSVKCDPMISQWSMRSREFPWRTHCPASEDLECYWKD